MRRPIVTSRNRWRAAAVLTALLVPVAGVSGIIYGRSLEYYRDLTLNADNEENLCLGREFRKQADMADYNVLYNPALFTKQVFERIDESRCIVKWTKDKQVKTLKPNLTPAPTRKNGL